MAYVARTHLSAGDAPSLNDYNQGLDNEAQLKAWVDDTLAEMTNKSGGDLGVGAVVILDGTSDNAFTTSSIAGDPRVVGVLWEAIANNASGKVTVGRRRGTVLVQGNVVRGHWLRASATAGRAEDAGTSRPVAGAIGLATTSYSGGGAGSVSALLSPENTLGISAGNLYVAGGHNGTSYQTTASKFPLSTETWANVAGAALSLARTMPGGVEDRSLKAFFLGGYTGSEVATADRLTYATDVTAAVSSANLTSTRGGVTCGSSLIAGYSAGSVVASVVINKTTFSVEVTAAIGNLPEGRGCAGGGSGPDYGYVMGGFTAGPTASSAIRKVHFATDVVSSISPTVSSARAMQAGNMASSGATPAAYIGGGTTGSVVNTMDKMPFATETPTAVGGASLSVARGRGGGGVAVAVAGYVAGGSTAGALNDYGVAATHQTVTDKVDFSTDVTAAVSGGSLPAARAGMAGATASL